MLFDLPVLTGLLVIDPVELHVDGVVAVVTVYIESIRGAFGDSVDSVAEWP